MKQGTTALTSPQMLDQLCDLLIPKPEQRLTNHLSSEPSADGTTGVCHLVAELNRLDSVLPPPVQISSKLLSAKSIRELQRATDTLGEMIEKRAT